MLVWRLSNANQLLCVLIYSLQNSDYQVYSSFCTTVTWGRHWRVKEFHHIARLPCRRLSDVSARFPFLLVHCSSKLKLLSSHTETSNRMDRLSSVFTPPFGIFLLLQFFYFALDMLAVSSAISTWEMSWLATEWLHWALLTLSESYCRQFWRVARRFCQTSQPGHSAGMKERGWRYATFRSLIYIYIYCETKLTTLSEKIIQIHAHQFVS